MTVAEVKEILQGAGVNLNDAQFAAIQSLLCDCGHEGGGTSEGPGASIADLTNPRYWLYKLNHLNYPAMNKSAESMCVYKDYDIGNPDGDASFLALKDILNQLDPNSNYNAVDYYDSVLKITQDKIPYVDGIIRHRLIDYLGNYGTSVVNYGELNINNSIETCNSFVPDYELHIPEDWTEHIGDSSSTSYDYLIQDIYTNDSGEWTNEVMIYHYLSYTYSNLVGTRSFTLEFVNFNGDTFENSNELIFVPVLTVYNTEPML